MEKGKLISDIELRITKSKPSDDLELERSLIGHWLDVVRDGLVVDELQANYKAGSPINPVYIEKDTCKVLVTEDNLCEECDDFYLQLTAIPLATIKRNGILKVTLSDGTVVFPASILDLDVVQLLQFAKPTEHNIVYTHISDKLYMKGVKANSAVDILSFTVYYVASYSNGSVVESDEFRISDALLPILLDEVEVIARRERGSEEDLENDGIQ